MDLSKALIRSVVRAFYETRHVLVIDALMVHSTLSNEDLAHLLSMQPKDLRKLCAKLREDRLLAVFVPLPKTSNVSMLLIGQSHSRQEIREGLQRPINRDYYYLDFHATIDAIKYRVLQVTTRVKQMFRPSEEKKDYRCPRCKAQWTQMEVLDNYGPMGFLCHRCSGLLEREEPTTGDSAGGEKQRKLAAQLEPVLKLLKEIDNATVPKNDFETALSLQIPIERDKDINPVRTTVPVETIRGPPAAVRGISQPVVQDLTVDLTSPGQRTAAEKASEENQKAAIAAQNMLPVWHTQSTVTGGSAAVTVSGSDLKQDSNPAADLKPRVASEDSKTDIAIENDESDELAAYYARMAQEKEKAEREDQEDEESSGGDGDEEDEFEDVGINSTTSNSQPNPTTEDIQKLKSQPSGVGRESTEMVSESGSSIPGSAVSTPAMVQDGDDPPAKRVKMEVVNGGVVETGNPTISDEDEEAEFEDAL
ncbi:MAG: hypothetical protein Q9219_004165 [cf. Caloplaca sp. 3 TL-2023]